MILDQAYYRQPTMTVARQLLGKTLVRRIGVKRLSGRIVETEAYHGPDDLASHASRGKTKEGPSRLDVSGKTLGVIGTGAIGRNVFELMKGFRLRGVAYDPYPNREWAERVNLKYLDSPDAVCEQADIITLHAASNDTIITRDRIDRMGPTTVLINCARRHLVDNEAVYQALKAGRIWGYGMDEIWDLNLPLQGLNIVVSPHVGSDTDMGKIGMQVMSAQAVVDLMAEVKPQYIVNPEVLTSPVFRHLRDRPRKDTRDPG